MPEEISDRIRECQNAQNTLLEAINKTLQFYGKAFETMEKTEWWQGESKEVFLRKLKEQQERVEAIRQEFQKEKKFYDRWDQHIRAIDKLFQSIPAALSSIMGRFKSDGRGNYNYNERMRDDTVQLASYQEAQQSFYRAMGAFDEKMSSITAECKRLTLETDKRIERLKETNARITRKNNEWEKETRSYLAQYEKRIMEIENMDKNKYDFTKEENALLSGFDPKKEYSSPPPDWSPEND